MPTTSNIQLSIPVHGANVDTWDADPVNNNSAILDKTFGGVAAIGLTNAPVSLSVSQAQNSILRFSGTLTGNVTVTLPAIVKFWTVQNNCTGAFVVTLTTGAGKIIGLPPVEPVDVFSDGIDLYFKDFGRIGTYEDYAGTAVPAWVTSCTVPPFLICDGTTFSAVTYPALNTILGGNTLPDLRGRTRFYLNGGTGRITTAGSGIDGNTIFSVGGVQTVTLDTTMIPSHTHTATSTDAGHTHPISPQALQSGSQWSAGSQGGGSAGASVTQTGYANITTINASTGGGAAHNNMPPTQISGIAMIRAG